MERSCGIANLLLQSRHAQPTNTAVRSSDYVVKAALGVYEKSMEGCGMRLSDYAEADFNVLLFYLSNIKTRATGSPVAQATVGTEPGNPAAAIISSRPVEHDLRSATAYAQVQEWLEECTNHHDDCPSYLSDGALPSRLLNLTGPRIRLCTDVQDEGDYAALSYCWGSPGQKHVLTQQVLDEWTAVGFHADSLPQTLQDAVEMARGLGLRYLWVDSLCIVQDSGEDMDRELAKMQLVYENAYVTIVAADASINTGFLGHPAHPHSNDPLPKTAHGPFSLPIITPTGTIGSLTVEHYHEYHPYDHAISRRLWTLQERLLSPRVLIYANHPNRLLWECQSTLDMAGGYKPGRRGWRSHAHGIGRLQSSIFLNNPALAALDGPSTYPPSPATSSPLSLQTTLPSPMTITITQSIPPPPIPSPLPLSPTSHTLLAWRTLIEDFSARLVSTSTDRLPAIAGLAAKFHRTLPPGTVYAAGLWLRLRPDETVEEEEEGFGVSRWDDGEFCQGLLWQFNRDGLGFGVGDDGVVRRGGLCGSNGGGNGDGDGGDDGDDKDTRGKKDEYIAPTWSWASRRPYLAPNWDWKFRVGRIGWLEPPKPPICRIVKYNSVLKSGALPYGELRPGTWLEMEGWVRRVWLEWCDREVRPATWRDAVGDKRQVGFWLLGVAEGRGLLLARVPGENGDVFARVRVHGFTGRDREGAAWRRVRLI